MSKILNYSFKEVSCESYFAGIKNYVPSQVPNSYLKQTFLVSSTTCYLSTYFQLGKFLNMVILLVLAIFSYILTT